MGDNERAITRSVGEILTILEEVRDNGRDMDLLKTAVEIYELKDTRNCEPAYQHLKNMLGVKLDGRNES